MKEQSIKVIAAESQEKFEFDGIEDHSQYCDTIKEAKERAKYFLTEEYRRVSETTIRLTYAQVLVNGKCRYDYFAKG
jgi:hypothetical protein